MSTSVDQIAELSREELDRLIRGLRESQPKSAPAGLGGLRRDGDSLPLSFAQQRLWFLDQLEPGSAAYNIAGAIRLSGPLDELALERSLDEIVRRHDALRTTFAVAEGQPVQVVAPPLGLNLSRMDLRRLPAADQEREVERVSSAESSAPFDLERGPLVRASLLRLGEREHLLLVTLHHIVSDGRSLEVFLRQLATLYAAFADGRPSPLAKPSVQYADFALWEREHLRGEALDRHLAYWRRRLAGAPPALELPADRAYPARRSARGGRVPIALPAALVRELEALSRRHGATLFITLLAALQTLLHRYTAREDLLVGSVVANRDRPELEELIGFFVNTLLLRGDLSGRPTFSALLARAREATLEDLEHQELPFDRLVEELHHERDPRQAPWVQVMLVLQGAALAPRTAAGLTLAPYPLHSGTAKFDLTLDLAAAGGGGLVGWLEYHRDLFEATTAARIAGHLQVLLEAVAADPGRRLGELPLLTAPERHQLFVEWRGPVTPYPRERTIHELFAEQAALRPDAVAVSCAGRDVTYRELQVRARGLASRLRALGVGPEVRVGICADRSLEMVVGILAILEAGGAYVPLDPTYPRGRLAYLLADGRVAAVLTQEHLLPVLPLNPGLVLLLDGLDEAEDEADAGPTAPSGAGPDSLAYVMYTSGSTGRPKGVLVTHRAVVRLVRDTGYADFGADETFLQLAPLAFDASTLEIWGPLLNGGRLVMFPARVPSLEELGEVLQREQVTTLWLTAGLFHQMVDEHLAGLCPVRQLLSGGDVLSPHHVRRVLSELPGRTLINGYGPTENTTFSICHRMTLPEEAGDSVPIGRPIANTTAWVLDGDGYPTPIGVPGELCVGGDGLARGYLGRPQLTAERFVPSRFGEPGSRLYRTGDLARWLPDGSLAFLGRIDRQIKLRGFRVEPGEIEATLRAHPAVQDAVVVVREAGPGDPRLVGYVVLAPEAAPVPAELREYLSEKLPAYMVPAALLAIEALPLTHQGKIDRDALPAPDWGRLEAPGAAVAPRDPVEELLATLWTEVLKLDGSAHALGVHDDFFALGGHSLLATRLLSRLRQDFRVELPLLALFEEPTIAGLARRIRAAQQDEAAPPIRPAPREGELPLSFAQERLWFLDQFEPGGAAYNVAVAARLRGACRPEVLAACFGEIVRRHEALRTTFPTVGQQAAQRVVPAGPIALPLVDLSGLPPAAREAAARRLASDEAARPFDLAAGPLLRTTLLRLAPDEHLLLLAMHHIVSDGWSMGILVDELSALYRAFAAGRPSPLPELAVQYADFTLWQREWLQGEALERQLAYWRRQLADVPPLDLPADRPVPAVRTTRGATYPVALSRPLSLALEELSRRQGVTLFMTLLAAFQGLLARYAGQEDFAVGSPIANRNRAELEGLVGFFVNTLVLRTDLSGDPSGGELLRRVKEVALDAYAHQDVPFEKLLAELRPERDLSRPPLFSVMLILQNAPLPDPLLTDLTLEPEPIANGTAKFDLTLNLAGGDEGLAGWLEYSTDLFDEATMARLAGHLETVLEGLVAPEGLERPLSAWPLLTGAERTQLLGEWNDNPAPAGAERCLHELVAEQAARTPDAVALIAGDRHLTHRELDCAANRLAHRLRRVGIGPESLVGICLERGPEMVIALLAVLKAGGAYVPLDPTYPRERLAYLLADARVAALLTQERLLPILPLNPGRLLLLDGLEEADDEAETGPPPPSGVGPDNLAYLIYTSGSTGRPKGVAIAHRSATAFVRWAAELFAGDLDGVLFSTSICFDLSIFELFVPLATGGRVILAENALELPRLPAASEVTLINTVPSAMAELLRGGTLPPAVRTVNLAGEPLPGALVRRLERVDGVRRVFNLYGPSEDTTYSTFARVDRSDRAPTIGRPVAGTRAYLLDRQLRPVPVGVPGELYLGGAGLARGYLNRPEITAERFVPDPFATTAGERLYATGDLARYLPDGRLDFLGRRDHQVKVRGFRIELGEIEEALGAHPEVREAAVLVRERAAGPGDGGAPDRSLVAFVALREAAAGAAAVDTPELRAFLQRRLPAYMVPSAFVRLAALPLSPNGKVDRRALARLEPSADREAAAAAPLAAPRTALERVVAEVWAAVLGVERVGVDDNFFDLGGHSLLATRVVSRLREALDLDVSVRRLFETPTVAALAESLEAERGRESAGEPPLLPLSRQQPLPLSFAQERLWFLDKLQPGSAAYNMPAALRLRGPLDAGAFAAALSAVVGRHESLRTTFYVADGQPFQRVAPPAPFPLPRVDLSGLPAAEREIEVRRHIAEDTAVPFDLERGPLLRMRLLVLETGDQPEHVLLLTMHHIVSDGWSMRVLVRELAALYGAALVEAPDPLPPLAVQYADFANWQRGWLQGEVLERQLGFWREQLGGELPTLDLPTDHPRPAVQTFRGGAHTLDLTPELTAELKGLSRRHEASLFMTLFAAFTLLLQRHAGQDDVLVGTPIAGRNRREIEGLIGFFLNTLVLRTDLSGNPAFSELLARVRRTALDAYTHQDLPFERLLQELRLERDLSRTPLFQVFFNFQNLPEAPLALPGVGVEVVASPEDASKFDLTLYLIEQDGGIHLHLVYNADLFAAARMRELLAQYAGLLAQVAERPEQAIDRFSLLTAEARPLLPDPNARLDDSWIGSVQEHFARQARQAPQRTAVVSSEGSWTYEELDLQSNRLANRLLAAGVGGTEREDAVAIYAHRSASLIWAVLGALKAGAAFVILDPSYPPARLIEILRLARPRAWLELEAAGPLPPELEEHVAGIPGCLRLRLPPWRECAARGFLAGAPDDDPAVPVGPDRLAYVAFTSGSTGVPKGILGRHGPLSHFLPWQCGELGLTASDRFSLLSGLAHDPLQRDIFTPLYLGAAIVVPDPAEIVLPGRLAAWMRRERVTVAHLTPAMGQVLTETEAGAPAEPVPSLRYVLLVGDVLARRDVARLRRLAPGVTCVNLYGSTETQRAVGYHRAAGPVGAGLDGEEADGRAREILPLGRGMRDVQLLVLNRAGALAGVGELGELCVRSPHLARGYLGDAAATAERFQRNPFGGEPGDWLYRTGDLGRYLPDGEAAFAGRADTQVKIRGFRVELGEIAAQLGRLPGVREAEVLAVGDAAGRWLAAFVLPEPGQPEGAAPSAAELRARLKQLLPAYMVPVSFVLLPKLPLTPNGKVDRRALLALAARPQSDADYRAPQTEAEVTIAGIVREVLGVERVGVDDNFFDLGGNSLALVKVQSRLQAAFQRELPVFELFTNPTVSALARQLVPAAPQPAAAAPADHGAEELAAGRRRRQRRFQLNQQAVEAPEAPEAPARRSP